MSDAIDRLRARQAEDAYGRHYTHGTEVLGDGVSAGDMVPWLSMLSKGLGGGGGSTSDAAKAQAAMQAAAMKKADAEAKMWRNVTLGLLGLGGAGLLWAVIKH